MSYLMTLARKEMLNSLASEWHFTSQMALGTRYPSHAQENLIRPLDQAGMDDNWRRT